MVLFDINQITPLRLSKSSASLADGEVYYLKIAPESKTEDDWSPNKDKLALSSDFARHLSDMGAPVARPIASKQGRYVEEYTFEDVYMVIQVAAEVPGVTVSEACKDLDVYRRCGIALAKLHAAAESFSQRSRFDEDAWEKCWVETGRKIPSDHETLLSEYKRIDDWLQARCPLPGGKGLTHGDTNILNFIDNQDRVSIVTHLVEGGCKKYLGEEPFLFDFKEEG